MEQAKGIVEELTDELQTWHDNLPENFYAKASEIEDAVFSLQDIWNQLEGTEFNVDFPSAF